MKAPIVKLLFCSLAVLMIISVASMPASAAPQGAAFTTFADPANAANSTIPNGGCLDGPKGIDCNNYTGKDKVYMSGGPSQAGLTDGCYYFTVIAPGSQNSAPFSESDPGNLSAQGPDTFANRIFQVVNQQIPLNDGYPSSTCGTNPGDHPVGFAPNGRRIVELIPYADTPNPGGVYILAVCQVVNGGPSSSASQCKYDAFKVKTSKPCVGPNCGGGGEPSQATVTACKFWDVNLEHQYDPNTPDLFIGNWAINASIKSGSDNAATLDANSKNTSNNVVGGQPGEGFGCATFTVTWPATDTTPSPVTVSFSEVTGGPDNSDLNNQSQSCDLVAMTCKLTPSGNWQQSAPYDFVAKAVDNSLDDTTVNPNDNVNVTYDFGNFIGQDLTVSKTATPSFTRTYNWTLSKSLVSPTGNPVEYSGSPTIKYSVSASETGFTDSNWQVTGTITVSNPNGFAFAGVTVSDQISDGTNCAVVDTSNGTGPWTVPAAVDNTHPGTLALTYTCTYASKPATYGTAANPLVNTAKASWDPTTYATPDDHGSGTANFYFGDGSTGNPTKLDQTVQITDCFNGPCPPPASNTGVLTVLGTLTATDSTPYATGTWTVTESPTIPGGTCLKFSNTAILTDDTGGILGVVITTASSADVTICNEKTNALTMGFWQNKNGQALIAGAGPSTGTCNLVAYLRTYVPFLDLSTTATCSSLLAPSKTNYTSSVTNYVAYVISLANSAGGGTAMTKGQMLATSLTAYFSETSSNPCIANYPWGTGTNQVASQGTIGNLACVKYQLNPIHGTEKVGIAFNGIPSASDPRFLWEMLQDTSANWSTFIACTTSSCKANAVFTSDAYNYINNSQANIAP